MGSRCWHLRTTPYYSPCHSWNTPHAVPSSPLRNITQRNSAMPCRLVFGSTFSVFRDNTMVQREKKHACVAHFDFIHHDEDDAVPENNIRELKNFTEKGSSQKIWTTKPDLLEPSLLGIQPEPPSWPERDEILRLCFERKVKSVGIPLSIRMIKKKLQLEKEFKDASDLTCCSVKKAFSSMLFIIQELQNYALQTRESSQDLQGVMAKLRGDMDASFVWLFQQVFWKTPTLMVYVMVFLANYSVFSMSNNTAMEVTNVISLTSNKSKQQCSQVDADVGQDEDRKELTEEEELLWNSMLVEVSMFQKELGYEVLDHETKQQFVAPVSVELEGDQYEEYIKTERYYKKHLQRTPNNSLLLSNYGHFLYLVVHDLDGAEEYYKRSVLAESPEAEAFSRYADFLWMVRKDNWAAELRYMQALEADPDNTYHASKYAGFLWNTGGQDPNSFPLEEIDNLQL